MTTPANAPTLTETYWNGAGSPSSYSVRVTVSNLSNACGGIGFVDGYRGYIGYVCASGSTWVWVVFRYDSTGIATNLGSGTVAAQGSYLIEITVTGNSAVQFRTGVTTVFSGSIASGYDTNSIALALGHDSSQAGQGYFSDFVYGRD